jgi:hypothetical protein
LTIQLAALLVAVGRVPLAAGYPRTGEMLAAKVIVVVQAAAAAMLFPYLLRSWPAAAAVVASAWPFDALAAVLSSESAGRVAWAAGYVTAWLFVLAVWNWALPEQGRRLGVAAAGLLVLGGSAVFYLRLEFGGLDATRAWAIAAVVPPLAALRPLVRAPEPIDWLFPAAAAVLGLIARHSLQPPRWRRLWGQVIHKP